MTDVPDLTRYRFHERDWDSYDALREWFEWEIPDAFNVATYVCDRWAGAGGDRPAVVARNDRGRRETWTYGDLDRDARALGGYLRSLGVARGDRVGVCCAPGPEAAAALVACWKVGAVPVPLSTLFGPDALAHRVRDATVRVAVVDDPSAFREVAEGGAPVEHLVVVGGGEGHGNGSGDGDGREPGDTPDAVGYASAVAAGAPVETVATGAEDDAVLLYTSGTTGDPKPVVHAHRFLLNNLPGFLTATCDLDLRDGDTLWTPAEWAWFATLYCVLLPGLYYGKRVLAYDGGKFDPGVALDLLEAHDVTQFVAPPTALREIRGADDGSADLSALRTVTCGAHDADVAAWVDDRLSGTAIHENYGQTEAGVLVGECTALRETGPGCMGMAVPGYDLDLLDPESGDPVGDDEVGEIAVRVGDRPVCFEGYWNRPELTAETVDGDRLLTGDLARRSADGVFTFEGRRGDLIVSAGHSIGPEEVENCLRDHPAVAAAGVIGVPDPDRGQIPKAFVEPAPGHDGDDELVAALQDHVRERLAKYKYPRAVEFLSDLPVERGKVRRAALREREGVADDG